MVTFFGFPPEEKKRKPEVGTGGTSMTKPSLAKDDL